MINKTKTEKLNNVFLQACRNALLQEQAYIADYCSTNSENMFHSLQMVLTEGIRTLHSYQKENKKGSLSYLQFSFLMSGIFSGEQFIKIDFYDDRFYADPYEFDCFWDYSGFFPNQSQRIDQIISAVRSKGIRVMDYEIYERFPTYRLGQMMLLQELLKHIQTEKRILSLLSPEADPEIKVIYGGYMGEAQRFFTVKKERV